MNTPVYVVSDLHIGSGGARDSFAKNDRTRLFDNFLDFIEKEDGELIILGDFIDLWRFAVKRILKVRRDLFDRLSEMKVSIIPGNHDQAILDYKNASQLIHPLFGKVSEPFVRHIGGKKISFCHGHELDPMSQKISPRMGRFLGMSCSLIENVKGYPVFSSDVFDQALANIEQTIYNFWCSLLTHFPLIEPPRKQETSEEANMRQRRVIKLLTRHENQKNIDGNDIAVSAHTHRPLQFQNWYFNSGSWTGNSNNFIRILPDGKVDLFNWEKNYPIENNVVA